MRRALKLVALGVLISFMVVPLNSVALAAKAKSSVIEGVLKAVDGEYVINSKKGTFKVTGQDFAPMEGKVVKATGTIKKGPKGDVLEVEKIEELSKVKGGFPRDSGKK